MPVALGQVRRRTPGRWPRKGHLTGNLVGMPGPNSPCFSIATQENIMKDTDIKRLLYTHLLCIFSIILSIFIPSFFLENFSILETHLTWLCICSVFVTAINLVLYLVVKPNASSKRSSLSYKVTRFLKCCIYFLLSCFIFHVIFVLYGAPLIELVLETFLFAVVLSTFTTVPCLCLLGPNIKAWLRVFSRNGHKCAVTMKNVKTWILPLCPRYLELRG
ncbi:phosphatidylinositol-glycan biosynthesis class F protein isoform X4 [Talpa occidentalis]|uniref:phosphatidylinositol-glycan biosynthesis class F protein isoform X4 n=1 Tax=Talpa occidentalis TaxID=50954 RepID=UPI0023F99483|nr:phosphatidylinositol-glycan biosynthesis class F protein isoform X4 [Talpa occidentalis]